MVKLINYVVKLKTIHLQPFAHIVFFFPALYVEIKSVLLWNYWECADEATAVLINVWVLTQIFDFVFISFFTHYPL